MEQALIKLLALALLDAVVFGLILTKQKWGNAKQYAHYKDTLFGRHYHKLLGVIQYGNVALDFYQGEWITAIVLFIFLVFAVQDTLYHIWLGHFPPKGGWTPFDETLKHKPTALGYWIALPFYGTYNSDMREFVIPERVETIMRLFGAVLAITTYLILNAT